MEGPQDCSLPDLRDIRAAHDRIAPYIHRTPVLRCAALDELAGARLFFKCENFQVAGAFKARGGCSAVLALPPHEARRGVVTHSSGNHGAGVAYAASIGGFAATIVMPRGASAAKIANVERFGARVVFCEPDFSSRQQACIDVSRETGSRVIPLSDDFDLIAGQATAALEFVEEIPDLDAMVIPVGGGGLICGSAIVLAASVARPAILGAEPAAADDAARSLVSGRVEAVPHPVTIADGLQATLCPRTLRGIVEHVRKIGLASEEGIARATQLVARHMKIVIEPSAAVPLACLLEGALDLRGRRVGMILTGGNVSA